MFTGIISEIGEVKKILCDGEIGDSVAVNGACHTVVKKSGSNFIVESMPETLRCTNFGDFKISSKVNLERPVGVSGPR